MKRLGLATGFLAALWATPSPAKITSLGASTEVGADAIAIVLIDDYFDYDRDEGWSGTEVSVPGQATAEENRRANEISFAQAYAYGSASAYFLDASSFSSTFFGSHSGVEGVEGVTTLTSSGYQFDYSFVIDRSYYLTNRYRQTAEGDGAAAFQFGLGTLGYRSTNIAKLILNGIGSNRVRIDAGTYYLNVKGGTAGIDGTLFNDLSFKLSAVPEPSTWGLMILGFGAIGGAMRRRKSVAAEVRFA